MSHIAPSLLAAFILTKNGRNVLRVSVISIRGAATFSMVGESLTSICANNSGAKTDDHQKLPPNLRPMGGHKHPQEIRGLAWHNRKNSGHADQWNPWQSYFNDRLVEHRSEAHWCSVVS